MLTLEQLEATEVLTPEILKDNILRIWQENLTTEIGTIDPNILFRIKDLVIRYSKNKKRNWPTPSKLLQLTTTLRPPTASELYAAFYLQKSIFPKTKIVLTDADGTTKTFKTPEALMKYLTQ